MEAQEHAARALWHLASSAETQAAIAESGGIAPLVAMLSAEGQKAPELAALTIVRLAESNPQVSESISNVGGIVPLVKLLSFGSPDAQRQAAAAISELALVVGNRDAIAHAGGIRPLIALLSSETLGTPQTAARALAHLARNGANQGEERDQVEPESSSSEDESDDEDEASDAPSKLQTPFIGGSTRRSMILQGGGIRKLISMLDSASDGAGGAPPGRKVGSVGHWGKVQSVVSGPNASESDSQGSSNKLNREEQAAAALCDLAFGDDAMQDAIIAAHGVAPLLQLVRSSTPQGQEHAARAIWYLCENVHNQTQIVEQGCIPELVSLLKQGAPIAQEAAAAGIAELASGAIVERTRRQKEARKRSQERAELRAAVALKAKELDDKPSRSKDKKSVAMAPTPVAVVPGRAGAAKADADGSDVDGGSSAGDESDDEEWKVGDRLTMIVDAGGVLPMVALLSSGSALAKEKAAAGLWHLALDPQNQTAIAKAQGIPPIVMLLDDATYEAAHFAARALARLSQESSDMQAQIAKRLVQLLSSNNTGAQERAAHALYELANDQPSSPVVIVNAGAISPLVHLLQFGTLLAKRESAAALACLARGNPKNQLAIAIGLVELLGSGEAEGQEAVTKLLLELASDVECREAIAKAGAIQRLVTQLKGSSVAVQEYAAAVLAHLTAVSQENVQECAQHGGIKPLVALLASESAAAQAHAAKVLSDMTKKSTKNQAMVVQEGGITPLVALLISGVSAEAKAEAAGALWSLATGLAETQATVAEAGAIVPLVQLLSQSDTKAQIKAAGALSAVASGSVVNQDAITAGGGIGPLVSLLKDGRERILQAHAAEALAELTRSHAANQRAVAEAGAIAPLIALIKSERSGADEDLHSKEAAAGAIWSLTSLNFVIQMAVADAGGIDPLVNLLGMGSTTAQKQAAGALASLALDNDKNEQIISKMIIGLLTSSQQEAAPAGAAEKAARAISRLARAHAANQVALARAGGINVLIAMVDDGTKSKAFIRARRGRVESTESFSERSQVKESVDSDTESFSSGPGVDTSPKMLRPVDTSPTMLRPSGEKVSTTAGSLWSAEAQKEIAGALWSMADKNLDNQTSIAQAGGIPLLIAMVKGNSLVQRNAAGALWSLAQDRANQVLIANMNGISPLVELLSKGNARAQETAAGALHSLAALESNRAAIAEAHGIDPLVAVFDGGSDAAKAQAAGALSTLVVGNENNQNTVATGLVSMLRSGSMEAQAHVTKLIRNLSLDPENRGPLAKVGGVPQLVRQLQVGGEETQSYAANALSQIALKSSMHRVQVTQQLVGLLGSDSEETRKRAGIALRDMAAEGGDESQKMVAMAGGVGPLVSLLKDGLEDGRVEAQEYALWSLSLATDSTSRMTIVQEGCTAPIIVSLKSGLLSAAAQEHAACVISGLARDSDNNPEIVKSGAIPPLVGLLLDGISGAKKHAATALARLATSGYDTQLAIAKAGAIQGLASWLSDDSIGAGMAELAARSLSDIAEDNPQTSDGICKADAISPLVAMLGPGRGNDAQKSAAGALATLAKVVLPPLPVPPRPPKQPKVGDDNAESEEEEEPEPPPPLPRIAPIAEAGGIPLLIELLKAERVGPHENATRALWHLADAADNKLIIAEVGGIPALVSLLLHIGSSEATQRHIAGAMNSLARGSTDNQLLLAKAKAIQPLVGLLGSESMETQEHAVGALLSLASHVESRNAVVKRLVAVLDTRNAAAQMRAAAALAVLSSRNTSNRSAIMEAGAIPPLVRLLGDGRRVETDTPQERAASVLADLARSGESKEEIVESGGVEPLVMMLSSSSYKAQTAAAAAIWHLASNGDNKAAISKAGAIASLVALLSTENANGQSHAAAALRLLATSGENKVEIIQAGGIVPLVQMLISIDSLSPEAIESAAAVLSELARTQLVNKQAIVDAGGIDPLVKVCASGSPGARKCAAGTLWGLGQSSEFKRPLADAGAIPPLVELLKNAGEAQSYALATLCMLAQLTEVRKYIFTSNGVEPLMEIAKTATGSWLRGQAVEVLGYLGIKDPLASTDGSFAPALSPHTPRAGAMSARGPSKQDVQNGEHKKESASNLAAGREPPDVALAMMTCSQTMLYEVAGSKALQLRTEFELTSDKAGELAIGRYVHVLEQKMTDDGKTRMAVMAEADTTILGWLTGSSADGKKNLKVVGRPVLQVTAAKPLVARAACDLASEKASELAPDAYVHVMEYKKMSDGAYRVGYAMEGKEKIKAWVTAISKDGVSNLEIIAGRRGGTKEKLEKDKAKAEQLEDEEPESPPSSPWPSPNKDASFKPQLEEPPPATGRHEDPPASNSREEPLPSAKSTGRNKSCSSMDLSAASTAAATDTAPITSRRATIAEPPLDSDAAPVSSRRSKSSSSISPFATAPSSARRSSSGTTDPSASDAPLPSSRSKASSTPRSASTGDLQTTPSAPPTATATMPPASEVLPSSGRRSSNKSNGSSKSIAEPPLAPAAATSTAPPAIEMLPSSGRRSSKSNGSSKSFAEPTANGGAASGSVLLARAKLKMRAGRDLDSGEAGDVRPGTRLQVLERDKLADGTQRACIALEGETSPLGWVSCFAKDGQPNLIEAPMTGMPAHSNASPSLPPQGSIAAMAALSGGAAMPTARSSAKAAAAAGAAKAALPPAAVAAAAAAARETVAAQAAVAQAAAAQAARGSRGDLLAGAPVGNPGPAPAAMAEPAQAAAPTAATVTCEVSPRTAGKALSPKINSPGGNRFLATSPKGHALPQGRPLSPRGPTTPGRTQPAPNNTRQPPTTPGRATPRSPSTPGRSTPSTPGRRMNEPSRSHPSQSR